MFTCMSLDANVFPCLLAELLVEAIIDWETKCKCSAYMKLMQSSFFPSNIASEKELNHNLF